MKRVAVSQLLIVCASVFLFWGCTSQPHKPAPVTVAGQYNETTRGSLASSTYIVQAGETLYSIAWRAGLNHQELARINGIAAPYQIYTGQKLSLQKKVEKPVLTIAKLTPPKASAQVVAPKVSTKVASPQVSQVKSKSKTLDPPSTKSYARGVQKSTIVAKTGPISWRWPAKGDVIRKFRNSQSGNDNGIDIAGAYGQKVLAAAPGKVVYAGSALRGYGKLIIVKHNDDYLSAYAYNSRLRVREKQQVEAGQHIADMGDTGTSSTRLRFEIRYKGQSVDPMRYLP